MDSHEDKTKQNYTLWLRHIKEERGIIGVIDETYGLYLENRLLRAELQQARSAQLPHERSAQQATTHGATQPPESEPPDADNIENSTEVVYRFLLDYFAAHTVSPSLTEVAAACGLSPKTAARRLERLERAGKIRRRAGARRGIRLVKRQQ